MDINMNLVLYITVSAFAVCLCGTYACHRGARNAERDAVRAAEALRASVTPVHVETVVVTST
jgi:hypothetical protein